jgi:hypothetical protein
MPLPGTVLVMQRQPQQGQRRLIDLVLVDLQ